MPIRFDIWLRESTAALRNAGVSSARLDCLILAEDATGKDRAWLIAHPEHQLDDRVLTTLNNNITQRNMHIPLAYIRGKSEFYGRTFFVDHHVLEPRPESEDIITLLRGLALPGYPIIIDIGTGSGALAITAKLELPYAYVAATDIDPHCLAVAERNAAILHAAIEYFEADLLQTASGPIASNIDVVLANLPYVPDSFQINPAAMNEPRLAIFGGPDGLDLYRRMFTQLKDIAVPPAYLLTEALPPQHENLAALAKANGYSQETVAGFVQMFKRRAA